jgi:O-antigen/teichoic acid export membrane protein
VLGFLIGLILIRSLDKQEYAYFTIAFSMQTTMNILADSGISTGISAIGGRVWEDKSRFGQLINTAQNIRSQLAVISAIFTVPIFAWLLNKSGASWMDTIILIFIVLTGFIFQINIGIYSVVLRLCTRIARIQLLDFYGVLFRLLLICIGILLFKNSLVAVAAGTVAIIIQSILASKYIKDCIDQGTGNNQEDHHVLVNLIKNLIPSSIFFCLQGQILILLAGFLGNAANVASLGALGRIAVIFTLLDSLISSIVLPRFSRCQSYVEFKRIYWKVIFIYAVFSTFLLVMSWVFSSQFVRILGEQYRGLDTELVLVILGTIFGNFVKLLSGINNSKAWVQYVWVEIPLRLVLQIFLLYFLNISTLKGTLCFGLLSNISPLFINIYLSYQGFVSFRQLESVQSH